MKTFLTICISFWLSGAMEAQIIDPDPPTTGTWSDVYAAKLINRLRQPPPMPTGGFWVVEDYIRQKGPIIVRYYTDQNREIKIDTLLQKRLNIRKVSVVLWLNKRLTQALSAQAVSTLALHR
ncbi:hypothetical protein J2I47_12405 [Fibrella sp. HMF5335]|uniref:Uncharacterized protein n=1 Tax=Fibrella rubiginis TaxID=2817060 RepID=A0A939GIF9_9BACT|nr:hypothetical protein [Fibrella rubiginis]MBO0937350.1 hypothetical protein [Fibrella rubiginis]